MKLIETPRPTVALSDPITALGMPARVVNTLARYGDMHTVKDLTEATEDSLYDLRGFGVHAMAEVIVALYERGLDIAAYSEPVPEVDEAASWCMCEYGHGETA